MFPHNTRIGRLFRTHAPRRGLGLRRPVAHAWPPNTSLSSVGLISSKFPSYLLSLPPAPSSCGPLVSPALSRNCLEHPGSAPHLQCGCRLSPDEADPPAGRQREPEKRVLDSLGLVTSHHRPPPSTTHPPTHPTLPPVPSGKSKRKKGRPAFQVV